MNILRRTLVYSSAAAVTVTSLVVEVWTANQAVTGNRPCVFGGSTPTS